MKIYHGSPSPKKIDKCKEAAPSYTHGAEWYPDKMTPHNWPYILDNGAYGAYINNEPWDVDEFVKRLGELDSMPREPDFVVLPGVVTSPKATAKRTKKWAEFLSHLPLAYPLQDGIDPNRVIRLADERYCDTLFIGGTVEWKRRNAKEIIDVGHKHGFDVHIGRPGDLLWAEEINADSVDLTTVVRNQDYSRLRKLEGGQQRL